jgi:hypothetical protein
MDNPTDSTDSNVTLHTDFFHGDVNDGLERMRRRLLDLTKRNRLLNYKHSKKGSLRVVDELPNQLFDGLVDSKEYFFKPVPRPRKHASTGAPVNVEGAGELTAAEHAITLGINTSYDLPAPPTDRDSALESRHTDRDIQTLLFPEDLEAVLRSLTRAARLAIEETGTNMLYLCFGFLEWTESDTAADRATAPLLLLPVSLRQSDPDPKTRLYRYALQYSGEDIVANISLQELLRQDFGLELPDVDEEELPENYFAKLAPLFKRKPEWNLRRQATLTLLSFGKLLMYRDLDPKTWPDKKGPSAHPRIREFFEGREDSGETTATDYAIDDPPRGVHIPTLVDEADSSQHSALADAAAGKNLVVSGPPGTGKSQTITNLIAVALCKGKRVLFVSEKLAALEVVRHRLERLGLGEFCLELHSHKSKKRALLDDVEARLRRQGTYRDPAALNERLKSLARTRAELSDYALLINAPFGALHQRLFDVIWYAAGARRRIGSAAAMLTDARVPRASTATLDEVEQLEQRVAQFARQFDAVSDPNGSIRGHPWLGLCNPGLSFRDVQRVSTALQLLVDRVSDVEAAAAELELLAGSGAPWVVSTPSALDVTCASIRAIAAPDAIDDGLLMNVRENGRVELLNTFASLVDRYRILAADADRAFGQLSHLVQDIERLQSCLNAIADIAPRVTNAGQVSDAAEVCKLFATQIASATDAIADLAERTRIPIESSMTGAAQALWICESANAAPLSSLRFRHSALAEPGVVATLTQASAEAASIRARSNSAMARLDPDFWPDAHTLRAHVVATANRHWWSFVIPSFRAAKRSYRAMLRSGPDTASTMSADFRELLSITNAQRAFDSNAIYRRVAGSHFG